MARMDDSFDAVTLPSGRTLAYAGWGDPGGFPVLYNTGGNSSRIEGKWLAAAAAVSGVRLIVPDRPGFGARS